VAAFAAPDVERPAAAPLRGSKKPRDHPRDADGRPSVPAGFVRTPKIGPLDTVNTCRLPAHCAVVYSRMLSESSEERMVIDKSVRYTRPQIS
jgi:hypothetical protein